MQFSTICYFLQTYSDENSIQSRGIFSQCKEQEPVETLAANNGQFNHSTSSRSDKDGKTEQSLTNLSKAHPLSKYNLKRTVAKSGSQSVSPRPLQSPVTPPAKRPNSVSALISPINIDLSPRHSSNLSHPISLSSSSTSPVYISSDSSDSNQRTTINSISQHNGQKSTIRVESHNLKHSPKISLNDSKEHSSVIDQNKAPLLPLDLRHTAYHENENFIRRKYESKSTISNHIKKDNVTSLQRPDSLPYNHVTGYDIRAQIINRHNKLILKKDPLKLGPPALLNMVSNFRVSCYYYHLDNIY